VQNTWLGPSGGLHVVDAGSGPIGTLRLQLGVDFFSTSDFMLAGDSDDYTGGTLSLGARVADFLEVYGSLASHANWNDHETPALLQVLGDTMVGAKAFQQVTPWLTLGGDLRFVVLNAIGDIGPSFDALSVGIRGNASFDLRALSKPAPLVARFTLDYYIDNSAKLIEGVERARFAALGSDRANADEDRHLVRRVERFALGINRLDMIDLGFGLEVPLRAADDFFVHPLVEWTLGVPVNRQGYNCLYVPGSADRNSGDGCLDQQGLAAMPSTFSFGARVFPPLRGLSALLAFDIGLSGTSTFVRELAPNKPYDVLIAVSYATDVREPPPPPALHEIVREVEKPLPPVLTVHGVVVDAMSGAPIEHAIVVYAGRPVTPQATSADGSFDSYPLDPGEVRFDISHPDYEPRTCSAQIVAPEPVPTPVTPARQAPAPDGHEPAINPYLGRHGETTARGVPQALPPAPLRCELTPRPKNGGLRGLIVGSDGKHVAGARVELTGPLQQDLVSDAQGQFELATLPVGNYTARVDADAYLIRLQSFEVVASQIATPEIALVPKPKEAQVELTKQEVRIRKQIFFKLNSAEISEKSNDLLSEIADVLLRNPQVKLVEIQGHTDSTGNADVNQALSQSRADAVRAWLVAAGVDASRLMSKGYGPSRPLEPNLTERARARNRRVQFIIKEQE
jgi:outer membrane protein OmpA-like peptidoglycan-associated protein